MNDVRYLELLATHKLPLHLVAARGAVWQQDNASPHKSRHATDFLDLLGFAEVLEWPAHSPDFSPIEVVWRDMGAALGAGGPARLEDLSERLTELWFACSSASRLQRHLSRCVLNMQRSALAGFSNSYAMAT